jgi:hypothetical protein
VRLSPLGTSANIWPIIPAPDDRWWVWSIRWNENWQGKPKYLEKTCPSATLSTTNPTWPDLGLNPGRRDGKLATNLLSYFTALKSTWSCMQLRKEKMRQNLISYSLFQFPLSLSSIRFFCRNRNWDVLISLWQTVMWHNTLFLGAMRAVPWVCTQLHFSICTCIPAVGFVCLSFVLVWLFGVSSVQW